MNESNDRMIAQSSCFLTGEERKNILADSDVVTVFRKALHKRVLARIQHPGLPQSEDGTGWWYLTFEYLSDAAMLYAIEGHEQTGEWLRDVTLSIARCPTSEWVGPWFRDHGEPYSGHLETAHVCWGVAAVLDLAATVFTASEYEEVTTSLLEKGVVLCERWLESNTHLANWRGIMLAGVLVPAAVLGDHQRLESHFPLVEQCLAAFQPDGSYAESLQYGNYLAQALMLIYESLVRLYPAHASSMAIEVYSRGLPWIAASMLYVKPLSGWGTEPRARAVNFNDSAAIFRPSGDLLLHVACRQKRGLALYAGLASHLFQTYYATVPYQGPHHLASFGFVNDWGFLTLPLLTDAAKPITPAEAGVPLTAAFENGNAFIRDAWDGSTVLAIQGGAQPLNGPGHLHGDVNSFMVAHRHERLLIDPGHSCYRNLIHGLESSSQTHNTCTFLIEPTGLGLQEDLTKTKLLEQQSILSKRLIQAGVVGDPVVRGNRKLLSERIGEVSVVGSESAALYGEPIQEFTRFWISAGSHVLFIVDRIRSAVPVRTCWNWVINNRDGLADITIADQEMAVKRPLAGLKLLQGGEALPVGPVYGYVHDAYHPEPARLGEGKPGSGLIYKAIESIPNSDRLAVHLIVMDELDGLDEWTLTRDGGFHIAGKGQHWLLKIIDQQPLQLVIESRNDAKRWIVTNQSGTFELTLDERYS